MGNFFSLQLNVENKKLRNIFLERFFVIEMCKVFFNDNHHLIPHRFINWKHNMFMSIYFDLQDKFSDFTIAQFDYFATIFFEYFISHHFRVSDKIFRKYFNTGLNIINDFKYMMTLCFTTDIESSKNNKSITQTIIPETS